MDLLGGETWDYLYDGNGNVVGLADGSTGSGVGAYVYGPFGEELVVSGNGGRLNRFRFSTKIGDLDSELIYYGYRWYHPWLGRWASRDPIGEVGGTNLVGFVNNRSPVAWDLLGLFDPENVITAVRQGVRRGAKIGGGVALVEGPEPGPADLLGADLGLSIGAGTLLGAIVGELISDALYPLPAPMPYPIPQPKDPKRRGECDGIQAAKTQAKSDYNAAKQNTDGLTPGSSAWCAALMDQIEAFRKLLDTYNQWDQKDCDSDRNGWADGKTEAKRRAGHIQQVNDLQVGLTRLEANHAARCKPCP